MIDTDGNDTLYLTMTAVEDCDVEQESALYELETGKKANKLIIRNRLTSTDKVLYYGEYHKDLDTAIVPWISTTCDVAVIDTIVSWASEQSAEVRETIFGFLNAEDREGILEGIITKLGLVVRGAVDPKGLSMSEIMRRALPATKEELIGLISSVSVETKRPAATVRQFLRTETRKGAIYLDDEGYYHV